MGLRIDPLGRQHRPLLKGFRNQHEALVEYVQRYALRHLERDLLARTYVAFRLFVTEALDAQAVGFYERFGLVRLADTYPCRMVLDLQPLLTATDGSA